MAFERGVLSGLGADNDVVRIDITERRYKPTISYEIGVNGLVVVNEFL